MFQIHMLRSETFVVFFIVYDRRLYIDDLVVVPRLYRVVLTVTVYEDHDEWTESGRFVHFQ